MLYSLLGNRACLGEIIGLFELEGALKAMWSHSLPCMGTPTAPAALTAPRCPRGAAGMGQHRLSVQHLTTLTVKSFFRIPNLHHLSFSLKSPPLVPSHRPRYAVCPFLLTDPLDTQDSLQPSQLQAAQPQLSACPYRAGVPSLRSFL